MPIVVEVKSPAEFDEWLRAKQAEQKLAANSSSAPAEPATPNAPATVASAAPAAVAQ
jgi:heme/copper-type cytochrome/quinol oxidase subunit 2